MQLTEADHHLARVMLEQRLVDQNGLRHLAYQAQQEGLTFQQIVQRSGLWPRQENANPVNDYMGTQVEAPPPTKNVVFGTHFGDPKASAPQIPAHPHVAPTVASASGSDAYSVATVQGLPSSELLAASQNPAITPVAPTPENPYPSDLASNAVTLNQHSASSPVDNSMSDTQGGQGQDPKELKNLGPYEIIGELGRGAMGVVYKARHTGLDRICALKVLISGEDASVNSLSRFVAEAKTAASLDDHPHIVKVLDSGHVDRLYYMAMELVEGLSLQKLIDADKVKPKAGARVVADIADALAYAHEKGVIHRDIKPDNILIDLQSTPKLNDFGVAKAAEESGQTMTGVVMGTLAFMAPEQAEDSKNVDARSDIYGLGAVLYTLITKRPPHVGTTAANVMASLMTREPPRPSSLNKEIDPDLERIVLKALERDPSKRFQNAGQLRDALNAYRKGELGLLDRLVPNKRGRKKPSKILPLAAGVGLVLVLSVMGFVLFGPQSKNKETISGDLVASKDGVKDAVKDEAGAKGAPEAKVEPKVKASTEKIEAVEKQPLPAPSAPLELELTRPTSFDVKTQSNTLSIEGRLQPEGAELKIAGKTVAVKNGRFSSSVKLPEGRSTITVLASVEGQKTLSKTINVACDSVPPVVTLHRLKTDEINYADSRAGFLRLSFSEPISDLEINGKTPPFFRVKRRRRNPPLEFRQKLTLPEGRHDFSIVVFDRAGNRSEAVKTTLVIDMTAPKIVVDESSFKSVDGVFEVVVRVEDASPVTLTLGETKLSPREDKSYLVRYSPGDAKSGVLKAVDKLGHETTKSLSPPLVLLKDHRKWKTAPKEAQDLEIDLVKQRLGAAYKWMETKLYSCGKSKYRIASFRHEKTGILFHLLPGGTYLMGTSQGQGDALSQLAKALPGGGRNSDKILATEQPQHSVTLPPFLMGRYEVSIAQWDKVKGVGDSRMKGIPSSRPIHNIDWQQAKRWCELVGDGFRLPSESEWEYACRANTQSLYYWGDRFDKSYVWHRKESKPKKRKRPKPPRFKGPPGGGPPGFPPKGPPPELESEPDLSDFKIKLNSATSHSSKDNGFGLVNMLGHVWEWCEDSYHTNYRGGPTTEAPRRGPVQHVKRGGSLANLPLICRPGFRDVKVPLPIPGPVGLRVAVSLP